MWEGGDRLWGHPRPSLVLEKFKQKQREVIKQHNPESACNSPIVFITQLCQTPCDPMDCSPQGSSVLEIPQARILESVAIPSSGESSWPKDWTQLSCIAGRFLMVWVTKKTQFSSVQSLTHVLLFATSWTAAHQASLSTTNSQSLFKLMPTESVMPSDHLILCHPLLLVPTIFPSIRVLSNESAVCIKWPKY